MWPFKKRGEPAWKLKMRSRIEILRNEEKIQLEFRDTLVPGTVSFQSCRAAIKAIRACRQELEDFINKN
jgi:hypothetical protein